MHQQVRDHAIGWRTQYDRTACSSFRKGLRDICDLPGDVVALCFQGCRRLLQLQLKLRVLHTQVQRMFLQLFELPLILNRDVLLLQ